jgi:hypothetical protein
VGYNQNMKLVVIIGPQAVGKMTVGHELEKITALKLFHNHMPIELVHPLFSYGTPTGKKLVRLIREEIFKEMTSSDQAGLIFTYVWYFDKKEDGEYLESLVKIFRDQKADIYFVELEADIDVRLTRNKTEHRLEHKPTKRSDWAENEIKESAKEHRLNSLEGEITEKNYLRINNTNLHPLDVAQKITETFDL